MRERSNSPLPLTRHERANTSLSSSPRRIDATVAATESLHASGAGIGRRSRSCRCAAPVDSVQGGRSPPASSRASFSVSVSGRIRMLRISALWSPRCTTHTSGRARRAGSKPRQASHAATSSANENPPSRIGDSSQSLLLSIVTSSRKPCRAFEVDRKRPAPLAAVLQALPTPAMTRASDCFSQ